MQADHRMNQKPPRTARWWFVTLAVVASAALLVAFSLAKVKQEATNEPTIPVGVALTNWTDNGQNGQYVLQMLEGEAPLAGVAISGVVINDSDCVPDVRGLNHCHNVIALEDGSRITVITTHVMMLHHCLKPGERVSLRRINASWVMAKLL